jgi:hypothetical protein
VLWVSGADGFIADSYTALSKQIFDIAVAEVESVIQPDSVADDIGWESVSFVGIHPEIIHFRELSCQYRSIVSTYSPAYTIVYSQ